MHEDDYEFRILPGKVLSRGGGRPKSFVNEVLLAAKKAGGKTSSLGRSGGVAPGHSTFGRGRNVFGKSRLQSSGRRVTIKSRIARHQGKAFRPAPMANHLSYLKRDGVTRDGERATMFDAHRDRADEKAFADKESGAGVSKKIHILIKPTRTDLITDLVINTDRRTYLLELRSKSSTYMASVSWLYAQDELIALRQENAAREAVLPIDSGLDVSKLQFRYQITGDTSPWRPLSTFDDGAKVYIEMPRGLSQGEAPPLFVIGSEGEGQLVNYRVRKNYYIVDRLFAAAELRLGGRNQQTVRITRNDGGWFW